MLVVRTARLERSSYGAGVHWTHSDMLPHRTVRSDYQRWCRRVVDAQHTASEFVWIEAGLTLGRLKICARAHRNLTEKCSLKDAKQLRWCVGLQPSLRASFL
eukprot:6374813-Amphidinium_carterae.1